ncbi:hypothetical protein Tco_0797754 [Tanacetum coccineum]
MTRLVRHEDQINEMQDHQKEIPLERVESMELELKVLRAIAEITEQEAIKAMDIRLGACVRDLEDHFGPPGER